MDFGEDRDDVFGTAKISMDVGVFELVKLQCIAIIPRKIAMISITNPKMKNCRPIALAPYKTRDLRTTCSTVVPKVHTGTRGTVFVRRLLSTPMGTISTFLQSP